MFLLCAAVICSFYGRIGFLYLQRRLTTILWPGSRLFSVLYTGCIVAAFQFTHACPPYWCNRAGIVRYLPNFFP